MPNPYHDENGKFCSKANMMGAVLRLQQEGRSAEATQLFLAYKAATQKTTTPPPAIITTPSQTPAPATTSPVDRRGPVVGTFALNSSMTGQEQAEEISTFIRVFGLQSGTREEAAEAESKLEEIWSRGEGVRGLDGYDPAEADKVQILMGYVGQYDSEEILFAYKNRLYIDNLPLDDSWGFGTKYGYKTQPAQLEPIVTEDETRTVYSRIYHRDIRELVSEWEQRHVKQDTDPGWGHPELEVQGATMVGERRTEEVSYGRYVDTEVYRDDATGDLFSLTSSYDSWDNGNDERTYDWSMVAAKEVLVPGRLKFIPEKRE